MGFDNEKPDSATDLLRCGQSSAARFGRCSEGQVPSRTGIPNRNPEPDPDFEFEPDFDFDFDFRNPDFDFGISISTLVQTMI